MSPIYDKRFILESTPKVLATTNSMQSKYSRASELRVKMYVSVFFEFESFQFVEIKQLICSEASFSRLNVDYYGFLQIIDFALG